MEENKFYSFIKEIIEFLNELDVKNIVTAILHKPKITKKYDALVKTLNDAFESNNLPNYLERKFAQLMNNPEISMI
jgi:hypothetical protein